MLKKLLFPAIASALLLLVACGAPIPTDTDWCYLFHFPSSDYGMSLSAGEWQEDVGYVTGESGQLSISYVHDVTVQPAIVIVTAHRAEGVTGDIEIDATALVFGVNVGIDQTLPAEEEGAVLSFSPESSTDNGAILNLTVETSQQVVLESIEVRGYFESPFNSNCNDMTPTPSSSPAPGTLTATPSTTSTATPSITPTPSPTPVDICSPGGYIAAYLGGHGTSGLTWTDVPWNGGGAHSYNAGNDSLRGDPGTISTSAEVLHVEFSIPSGWTRVEILGAQSATRSTGDTDVYYKLASQGSWTQTTEFSALPAQWKTLTPVWAGTAGTFVLELLSGTTSAGSGYSYLYAICVYGANTPTPTNTDTPTLTNTPTATNTLPFTATNTFTPSRTPTRTQTPTRTPLVIASPTRTASPVNTSVPSTATGTPSRTATGTPPPTYTPAPTQIPEDDSGGDGDGWTDCDETIIVDGLDDLFYALEQYWSCSVVPYFANILNSVNAGLNWIGGTVINFFAWLSSLWAWGAGSLTNLGIQIGNIWQLILSLLLFVLNLLRSIWQIILLLIAIGIHIFTLVTGWIDQAFRVVSEIINAWQTSAPQPIPGLPQCVSDPMASNICAFYYVAENTLLSDVLGGVIVPLLVLLFDMVMIFYFIRFVKNVMKKAEDVI